MYLEKIFELENTMRVISIEEEPIEYTIQSAPRLEKEIVEEEPNAVEQDKNIVVEKE